MLKPPYLKPKKFNTKLARDIMSKKVVVLSMSNNPFSQTKTKYKQHTSKQLARDIASKNANSSPQHTSRNIGNQGLAKMLEMFVFFGLFTSCCVVKNLRLFQHLSCHKLSQTKTHWQENLSPFGPIFTFCLLVYLHKVWARCLKGFV
jgi:hypothetical protein